MANSVTQECSDSVRKNHVLVISESDFPPMLFTRIMSDMKIAQYFGVFVDNFGNKVEISGEGPAASWVLCLEEH